MADEHQQLLQQLKTTVEGLLISQVSNVWSVYGGLTRLHNVIYRIFIHKCKTVNQQGEPDCWPFIQGLSWLQPPLAASPTFVSKAKDGSTWLRRSLESHTLSQKLSWLLSDLCHLSSSYEDSAVLRQPPYSEAVLICLRAVEDNQLSMLTDIHPSLFLSKWKTHRRCSSFPDVIMPRAGRLQSKLPPLETEMSDITSQASDLARRLSTVESTLSDKKPVLRPRKTLHREWKSLPSILDAGGANITNKGIVMPKSVPVKRRPRTQPSSPACHPNRPSANIGEIKSILPSVLKIDYKQLQKDPPVPKSILKNSNKINKISCNEFIVLKEVTKSDPIVIKNKFQKHSDLNVSTTSSNGSSDTIESKMKSRQSVHEVNNSIYEETDSSCVDNLSLNSFHQRVKLKSSGVRCGIKNNRRKSFMESGGNSVQPMFTGYFPRPTKGQSLASFLSSGQFAGPKAELDRENAHFAISEAVIAAIEQVKYDMWARSSEETIEESDEEINQLKQRIRLRRRQNQEEKQLSALSRSYLYGVKTDTTTSESVSPLSSSPEGSSGSVSTDGVDDLELDDHTSSNLSKLADSGMSLSLASLFSEAELSHVPPTSNDNVALSAEGVALSLLKRFSDKQLPRASDIQWLVSERDAGGQRLLPLPTSWPVSPDEAQDMRHATCLRGTAVWAPPRPQIIFNPHPPPDRQKLMEKQKYRCAGCGMPVARKYATKFRYCEYLGRYFCTGCHTNQLGYIPGRIIQKWDFTRCAVSNFSYRLLDHMSGDPLFNINDLNPSLFKKIRPLEKTKTLRIQVHYLKDFLNTCRFAKEQEQKLQAMLSSVPAYFLQDPHMYSIVDMVQVRQGCLNERLQALVQEALSHVSNCVLCQGRGYVCEACKKPDVIFPWQLGSVHRCARCANCFHLACYTPQTVCGRCSRLTARRKNSVSVQSDNSGQS